MVKDGLIYIGVFVGSILVWLLLMVIVPVPVRDKTFNIAVSVFVPSLATFFTTWLGYRISPRRKLLMSIIVFALGIFIAYPVYGPGMAMDTMFQYNGYDYIPMVGMLLVGVCTIIMCKKRYS